MWSFWDLKFGKINQEIREYIIAVLGISELKWTRMGDFQSGNYRVFYSEHDKLRQNRVAFILKPNGTQAVGSFAARPDWVMSLRLLGKSINITIIHLYAPTPEGGEDPIESFMQNFQEEIKTC